MLKNFIHIIKNKNGAIKKYFFKYVLDRQNRQDRTFYIFLDFTIYGQKV